MTFILAYIGLFKTKFNISIFVVYFDLFYKKNYYVFSSYYILYMGTKLSERHDE
jgi:hypothetical protein